MPVVVVAVAAERLAEAVAVIEHRRYAVEAEPVKVELRKPILAVGQEEVDHLVLAVVEAKAVPCGVFAAAAAIKILGGVAGEVAEAFDFVLHSVALHHIHNYGDACLMRLVDELLQLFGRAEAGGRGEERTYVIAEAAVIGVLLNGHNLDAVVTLFDDARQHVFAKFVVSAHLFSILRHTDMAFVNQQRGGVGLERLFLKHIFLFGCPYLCAENLCVVVLHHAAAPCGNALAFAAFPVHFEFIEVLVFEGFCGELEFPVAGVFEALESIFLVFLPAVEIAYEINGRGIGRPFADYPTLFRLVQTEIQMTVGKFRERFLAGCEFVEFVEHMVVAALDCAFKGFEPRVVFHDFEALRFRCGCLACFLGGSFHNILI